MLRIIVWLALGYLLYRFIRSLVHELTGGDSVSSGTRRTGRKKAVDPDVIKEAEFEEIKEEKDKR